MSRVALFALLAMMPAALNTTPAAAAGMLAVPVCTGDGQVHMVNVPLGDPVLPGSNQAGCCVKGCHGGSSRKRSHGDFDPSQ